jgi:toxin-antitoxin system PIN domain toxin
MAAARVALLDVNVLIALFFPEHVHHELAHDWFAGERVDGWATCPTTENGFVRVGSQLASEDGPLRPQELIERLERFCSSRQHRSWQDTISLRDSSLFVPEWIAGHRNVTDVYLLGMAKANGGRLVTFDGHIPVKAVKGATASHLEVIAAAE